MKLLNYIDKKFTLQDQLVYIISFLFIGMPLGYLFSQGINILIYGWEKYHFNKYNLLGNITTNLLILTPLIINYIRHIKKYNKICKKILENYNHKYKIKALYDYKNFIKNDLYDIDTDYVFRNGDKKFEFFIMQNHNIYNMRNIINKFELDDIKEDRLRKLKKLKRIW
jgi:hypothetical protein